MTITAKPQGLVVIGALNLPYLTISGSGDYYVNASPPYYSSFLCTGDCSGRSLYVPDPSAFVGLVLLIRCDGTIGQVGIGYGPDPSVPILHLGGGAGNTSHVKLGAGCEIMLHSDGTCWQVINSFVAAGGGCPT